MLIYGRTPGPDSLSAKRIHFHLEERRNLPLRNYSINLSIVNNNYPSTSSLRKKKGKDVMLLKVEVQTHVFIMFPTELVSEEARAAPTSWQSKFQSLPSFYLFIYLFFHGPGVCEDSVWQLSQRVQVFQRRMIHSLLRNILLKQTILPQIFMGLSNRIHVRESKKRQARVWNLLRCTCNATDTKTRKCAILMPVHCHSEEHLLDFQLQSELYSPWHHKDKYASSW